MTGKEINIIVPYETINDMLRNQLIEDHKDADHHEQIMLEEAIKYYSTPQEFGEWRKSIETAATQE